MMTTTRKLTAKLNICADARLSGLMDRRTARGAFTVVASTAKAVLWALVNASDASGVCWPDIETIAEDADTSPRTVQRVIALLSEEGLVTVTQRTHGPGARKKSESTNLYTIDWDALESLSRARQNGRHADVRSGDNGRHADVRTDDTLTCERTPTATRTDANGPQNGRQPSVALRKNRIEPTMNPPLPPEGGIGGGAVSVPPLLRERAEAIVAAYPTTSSDVHGADVQAALAAIEAEHHTTERVTAEEILAAAHAVRAAGRREPLWPRTWLRKRGYVAHAMARRAEISTAPPGAPTNRVAIAAVEQAALDDERRRVDEDLAGLPEAELEQLAHAARAEEPDPFVRQRLEAADPRSHRLLRARMADRLHATEAVA